MPEERVPYIGEGEQSNVERLPDGRVEVRGIIIQKVASPKWSKDGQYVYVDMTDQYGQTRTFIYPTDIALNLTVCLTSGMVGARKALR